MTKQELQLELKYSKLLHKDNLTPEIIEYHISLQKAIWGIELKEAQEDTQEYNKEIEPADDSKQVEQIDEDIYYDPSSSEEPLLFTNKTSSQTVPGASTSSSPSPFGGASSSLPNLPLGTLAGLGAAGLGISALSSAAGLSGLGLAGLGDGEAIAGAKEEESDTKELYGIVPLLSRLFKKDVENTSKIHQKDVFLKISLVPLLTHYLAPTHIKEEEIC